MPTLETAMLINEQVQPDKSNMNSEIVFLKGLHLKHKII